MNLDELTVITTNGKPFSGQDSARLALLIYRRFGCDSSVAANKWRHLLGNSCTEEQFMGLVRAGKNCKRPRATPARLDPNGTEKPKTRLVDHVNGNVCFGGVAKSPVYEDESGNKIPLK